MSSRCHSVFMESGKGGQMLWGEEGDKAEKMPPDMKRKKAGHSGLESGKEEEQEVSK